MKKLSLVKYFPPTDLAYYPMLKLAIEKLAGGNINFEKPDINEIIEICYISRFFEDGKIINEDIENLINDGKKYLPSLRKAQSKFFNQISPQQLDIYFSIIKFSNIATYHYEKDDFFYAISRNVDFSTSNDEIGKVCLKHVYPDTFLKDEKFCKRYIDLIHAWLIKYPSAIEYLVQQYDDGNFKSHYFLPLFSADEVGIMIKNYLNYGPKNMRTLQLLKLHIDNKKSYKLLRSTRLLIEEELEKLKKDITEPNYAIFHEDSGEIYTVDTNLDIPIKVESNKNNFKFTASSKLFCEANSFEDVMHVIEQYSFVLDIAKNLKGPFNKYKQTTLSDFFEPIHSKQYGNSLFADTFAKDVMVFKLFYSHFEKFKFPLEDAAKWFVQNILRSFHNVNIELDLSVDGHDDIKCEHLFNQIYFLLKQYRIYVEERTISRELIKATKDECRIEDIPSLVQNKYASINENNQTVKNVMFLLFSDQSALSYINSKLNDSNLFSLITNSEISYDCFQEFQKERIDYLINLKILKVANNKISFYDKNTLLVWTLLYNGLFIAIPLIDENVEKLVINYAKLGYLNVYSSLFSHEEADFLNFILNNSKFSNSLALRNNYEHGNSSVFNGEENKRNYIIGLKTLFGIIFKIYYDLLFSMFIKH